MIDPVVRRLEYYAWIPFVVRLRLARMRAIVAARVRLARALLRRIAKQQRRLEHSTRALRRARAAYESHPTLLVRRLGRRTRRRAERHAAELADSQRLLAHVTLECEQLARRYARCHSEVHQWPR